MAPLFISGSRYDNGTEGMGEIMSRCDHCKSTTARVQAVQPAFMNVVPGFAAQGAHCPRRVEHAHRKSPHQHAAGGGFFVVSDGRGNVYFSSPSSTTS